MSTRKILVVEDNPVNLELVTDLLEVAGLGFVTATNAEEGIRLAEQEQPTLILMDIQLPAMDGLEATRLLKANPRTRALPIVALTAHAMKGDEERALQAGCIGYITKPINTRQFARLLNEFLQSGSFPKAQTEAPASLPMLELVRELPFPLELAELAPPRAPILAADPTPAPRRRKRTIPFSAAVERPRIFVVEEDLVQREQLVSLLHLLGYDAEVALPGPVALERLDRSFDVLLVQHTLPSADGIELCRRIREERCYDHLPLLLLGQPADKAEQLRALEVGVSDWLATPIDRTELDLRLTALVKTKRATDVLCQQQRDLEEVVRQRTQEVRKAQEEIKQSRNAARQAALDALQRMAYAAEFREGVTAAAHIRAVGQYSAVIARALSLSAEEAERVLFASQVHDIGLLALDDSIVNKKTIRDEYEESVYRQHTVLGARLLSGSPSELLRAAELIALTHHERWDGKGYPQGLAGEGIPLFGRIVAVADTFDQWTSFHHRRLAVPNTEALALLEEEAGKAFDPRVVEAVRTCFDELLEWQRRFRRTEEPPDDLPVSAVSYAV